MLILLEPWVTGVFATLSALGLAAALLFTAAFPGNPHVHVGVLLGGSAACVVAIFAYGGLIKLLTHE